MVEILQMNSIVGDYYIQKMDNFDPAQSTPRTERDRGEQSKKNIVMDSGHIQLPSSSQILERLYNDHGVRVRMVRRGRASRVPTVREMIDFLSKKHDRLLEMEGKKGMETGSRDIDDVSPERIVPEIRCLSERAPELDRGFPRRKPDYQRCQSQREHRHTPLEKRKKIGPLYIDTRKKTEAVDSSSSTPTVPYSTADILYGNDVNRREGSDDLRRNSVGEGKDLPRQKSKESDSSSSRRPNSKSGNRRSISIDAVAFDKECDPLKSISSSLPPAKPTNHFRPNGIRTNLLKGEPGYSQKPSNGAAISGRDQDDLIATGTEWGYNSKPTQPTHHQQPQPQLTNSSQIHSSGLTPVTTPQQPVSSGRDLSKTSGSGNNTNNAYPAKVASSSSSSHQSMSSTNNTMVPTRKYASSNVRPIVVQNNVSGKKVNNNNNKVEEDPKYTDPMIGAPASFQQRIIELGALEGDTVRWERTKRLKKKKQDRDS